MRRTQLRGLRSRDPEAQGNQGGRKGSWEPNENKSPGRERGHLCQHQPIGQIR